MPRIFSEEQLGKDRVAGFYETPLKTVEYICNSVLPFYAKGKKILDPTVGDGVFLHALLQAGVDVNDLYGFDLDTEKVSLLRNTFPKVQVYDVTNPFPGSFDIIVGNPPYHGDESYFVREHRERLKRIFTEIDAKNTFSMISYQAIQALAPGGVFSMILSDAFLTNSYYAKFRTFLLRNLRLQEMLLAPWKLFHGRSADVRTCILTGIKKDLTDTVFGIGHDDNRIRLVDRVQSEDEYANPPKIEIVGQSSFEKYPNSVFLIGIPDQIRQLYLNPPARLGDIAKGGTGISTGQDRRFLRRKEEIPESERGDWVPYYKNGARQPYWYEPEYFLEKAYRQHSDVIKNYMIRNERFFFKEGVSCSSVGVRFSAAYMPPGCLFGVNANFFFADQDTMFYVLALLNTKLAWYFARKVLSRTNNISANYIRLLPYFEPDARAKKMIAQLAQGIVNSVREWAATSADHRDGPPAQTAWLSNDSPAATR